VNDTLDVIKIAGSMVCVHYIY